MSTDFRDGRTSPRRGRTPLGGFLWLARVFDKARASAHGTIHDYIYPCPIDEGLLEHWGVTPDEFDAAILSNQDDASIEECVRSRAPEGAAATANAWLIREYSENLDRQDREEGVFGG